ncbi:MAG TPA: methyltransferase domain-containing protein [Terriglobia bacterium]|nr:methyltransferase domain-containing protein [Terriglobia bacterium]
MRRVTSIELLDQGAGSLEEIQGNLADLWRVNRYLGGVFNNLRLLRQFFRQTEKRRVRVLEVGAGDGRLAARLRRELSKQGIDADFFVLDCQLSHLLMGRPDTQEVHPVVADALALPFAPSSFDIVTCNLFLHHFSGARALQLLKALASMAREAVLINDLRRHWLPYWFVRLTPWLWRVEMSRLDGMASARQAYTRAEVVALASAASLGDFEVHRLAPFRLGLVLWMRQHAGG